MSKAQNSLIINFITGNSNETLLFFNNSTSINDDIFISNITLCTSRIGVVVSIIVSIEDKGV